MVFPKPEDFETWPNHLVFVFRSPEPKALGGAYSIGRLRRPSFVVRPSTISNDLSSETTTKIQMQPPGLLGTKSCSNSLSHMTKMATMPIYGKNLKNLLQNQ